MGCAWASRLGSSDPLRRTGAGSETGLRQQGRLVKELRERVCTRCALPFLAAPFPPIPSFAAGAAASPRPPRRRRQSPLRFSKTLRAAQSARRPVGKSSTPKTGHRQSLAGSRHSEAPQRLRSAPTAPPRRQSAPLSARRCRCSSATQSPRGERRHTHLRYHSQKKKHKQWRKSVRLRKQRPQQWRLLHLAAQLMARGRLHRCLRK